MNIEPFNLKKNLKDNLTQKLSSIDMFVNSNLYFTVELSPSDVLYGCKKSFNVKTTHFIDQFHPEFDQYFPEYSEKFKRFIYNKYTNYELQIEQYTENKAQLEFKGCGNEGISGSHSDIIFIIQYVPEDNVEIIGNNIKVKLPIDILKVIEGGTIQIDYLKEGFDIEVDDFPDPLIEENKEYTIAKMGLKGEGNLTLVFTYDYTNAKERRVEKLMNRLKI
jgi:hypothetical protein